MSSWKRQIFQCCLWLVPALAFGQTSNSSTVLVLNDGREFKAGHVVAIGASSATIAYQGGIVTVPIDSLSPDILARARENDAARRAIDAKVTADISQRDASKQKLVAPPLSLPTQVGVLSPQPPVRRRTVGPLALVPTGESGPKDLIENACVVVSNAAGTGTGFILRQKDGFVLVSNQHVIDGGAPHKYELSSGKVLKPLTGLLAKDRDVVVFDLPDTYPSYFEMEPDINAVGLEEEVLIYGNSLGEGVRISKAKLVAKGKNQIEVSGGIVGGNSGGPIIRAKTGKVIGVSTFVKIRGDTPRSVREVWEAETMPKVRYFGVRIDGITDYSDFDLRKFLGDVYALEADQNRLRQALSLVVLFSQRLGNDLSRDLDDVARRASPEVTRTVQLLIPSTFYPGTVNKVDVNLFRTSADGFFAPVYAAQSYIHARKREELEESRVMLVREYNRLLGEIPVR